MPTTAQPPLLKTRISMPPSRADLVMRPRLVERLQAGLTRPLTLISAPAGSGKTTLASCWLSGAGVRVAWLSLDEDDNDPVRFIYYLVGSLQAVAPGVGRAPLSVLGSLRMPAPRDLVALLLNEIAEAPERIVLVLDDLHVIHNPEIDAAIAFLVERMPERLRLVVITREEPRLPLARWRSLERISEIGIEQLRFSPEEAATFLSQTMGLDLDDPSARTLALRTEGWVAGLQMAALSLQQHAGTDGLDDDLVQQVAGFCGEHRYVIDYMASEVVRQQPEHIHEFLRKTAILRRLCAPLCDAVTGRSDAKVVLARLEQANMFLLPLDDERRWYRYHQLFADFLRAGLDRNEERVLHLRASAWYEGAALGQEAMRHALAAADVAATVRIFRAEVDAMLGRGEIPTLLAWLEMLPEETVRSHSDLAGYKAWLLYLRGETAEAQVYSQLARILAHTDAPAPQQGMLLALQAYLTLNWGTPKDAIPLALQALAQLGDSPSFFRAYAMSFLGQAQGLSGDRRSGAQTLRAAVELGKKQGNQLIALDALGHLARTLLAQGRLREAIVLCREAVEKHVDARGEPLPVAGLLYVCLGALHYEADELEWAQRCLTTGVSLCQQLGLVYYTLIGQRALAKMQHVCGEREAAWNTLAAAREVAERSDAPRRRHFVSVLTAELHLREGNVPAAARALAEARKLLPSGSEHEALTQARLLLAQHHASAADNLLAMLEQGATRDECEGLLISIYALQALCRNALGQRTAALERLERAVSLGAAAGYRRTFLDEGAVLTGLLRQVRQVGAVFVSGLLQATSPASRAGAATRALPEPLSTTELKILGLLDRGLTNQEIADELSITVGTAKWHLNHIFGKLLVRNRTMALARARELSLL